MFEKRFKSHHDAEASYKDLLTRQRASLDDLYLYLAHPIKATQNAIYIHVPFCDKICSFCNMNRTLDHNSKEEYVNDLIQQIKAMAKNEAFKTSVIEAVYFGGGTPTTMSPSQFVDIISALKQHFKLVDHVEITCETTLHNLSDEHIATFNNIGINRLSIGIQSFQDEGRVFFNRTFHKKEVIQKLQNLRRDFNGIICVDKIYNYPGETKAMVLADAQQIIDLEIDSVSFYSLMIHQGSYVSKKYKEEQFSDEQDLLFHDVFVDALLKTGDYELIELTKIVRKNRDSYAYMSIRNSNGNTIPLGRGAGGKIDKYHIYNMDFDKVMIVESTNTDEELAHLLYGMFQKSIIHKQNIEMVFTPSVQQTIQTLKQEGYLVEDEDTYTLTSKGLFYGNNIGGLLTRCFLLDMKSINEKEL